jgi:hypothetical protein
MAIPKRRAFCLRAPDVRFIALEIIFTEVLFLDPLGATFSLIWSNGGPNWRRPAKRGHAATLALFDKAIPMKALP